MNRDEIIRMANEVELQWLTHNWLYKDHLVRFAALVAAAERDACAKVVEADPSYDWHRFACEAAAAIRGRGRA